MSPLDEDLGRLPAHDIDAISAERLRRRAQRALAEERRLAEHPVAGALARLWSSALEPTLLAVAVSAYLIWAVRAAEALCR